MYYLTWWLRTAAASLTRTTWRRIRHRQLRLVERPPRPRLRTLLSKSAWIPPAQRPRPHDVPVNWQRKKGARPHPPGPSSPEPLTAPHSPQEKSTMAVNNPTRVYPIPANQRPPASVEDSAIRLIKAGWLGMLTVVQPETSWLVPSENIEDLYTVSISHGPDLPVGGFSCTCLAGEKRMHCKHIVVAQFLVGASAVWGPEPPLRPGTRPNPGNQPAPQPAAPPHHDEWEPSDEEIEKHAEEIPADAEDLWAPHTDTAIRAGYTIDAAAGYVYLGNKRALAVRMRAWADMINDLRQQTPKAGPDTLAKKAHSIFSKAIAANLKHRGDHCQSCAAAGADTELRVTRDGVAYCNVEGLFWKLASKRQEARAA